MNRMKRRKIEKKAKEERGRLTNWLRSDSAKCTLIVIIGMLLIWLLLSLFCAPERYDLSVGTISRQTINANKAVVDEITTEERRKAAAAAVEPTYHLQEGVSDEVMTALRSLFEELRTVQQYGLTLREEDGVAPVPSSFSDEEIEYAQKLVTTINLSRYQATTLMRTGTADFDTMVSTVTTAVANSLNTGIREGRVSDAISTVQQIVGFRVDISLTQNILPAVLRTCIQPNLVIDQERTEQARLKAMDAVEPIMYQQGQNIIREGDVIRQNQVEMLRSLGQLLDNEYDYSIYAGTALLSTMAMAVLLLLLWLMRTGILSNVRRMIVIISTMVIHLALCGITLKVTNANFAPLALSSMLLTSLIGLHAALPATVSMAVMLAGLTAGDSSTSLVQMTSVGLMVLVSGSVSIAILRGKPQRVRVILCGLLAGMINALIVIAMGWMISLDTSTTRENMLWSFAGGLLSGVLAGGLQPLEEAIFSLATPSRLLELGNPNNPLLRRLLLEAAGTYHHSIIVANLSEAAAEKVGANPLLTRTGAYFHDVGKLKRPQYFKENQMGVNPLDQTDPYVSAAIVTSHTRDGVQLAQKYRLPLEIQEIIAQHHGDTPVMYFYHKALQLSDGRPVDISDFRYDGTRPTSKEAAIVMLADTVEAAVRAMPDPTPASISQNIERLVRGKLEDGQLSNSPLTLRDIDGICAAFSQVLNGVFHERIEYPKVAIPKREVFGGEAQSAGSKTSDGNAAAPKADAAPAAEREDKNAH